MTDSLQIIFREGTPARDPQVLIIAPVLRPGSSTPPPVRFQDVESGPIA